MHSASGARGRFDVRNNDAGSSSASGSGSMTIHGDPARRTLSGKRISIVP
ncbi:MULTISPECIES: hypothetical protein [unclassified Janthinobacterium]|nr:hypothetical protein [Janthinobacterium sp. CG_23.4]MDH6159798.1 hypothetical protein [Janthinobacterium sp. CG_23.4]